MQFSAPAKINLSLRVLRRREDGFHEIETLMAPIAIRDTLEIGRRESGGIEFTCSDTTLPTDGTNLVVRAAMAFAASAGMEPHVRILLKKETPHGAGLGGGSSDAAATLLALNEIFETRLTLAELTRIAAEIGSDIPFFLARGAAWCRGRGEFVEPCALPHSLPLLLIKPAFGVPTPWAYRRWRDSLEIPGVSYAPQVLGGITLVNDLERPVFEKFIQLAEMKRWLLEQPETAAALMSGSGSTMFAVLREKSHGPALLEKAREQFGPHTWLALTEAL
ncbi:MAG: 4-(cytidine 5'-diphospho)-2-C-methyl-D-erythritol kinase [Chthoniobacteraceae bacterium]